MGQCDLLKPKAKLKIGGVDQRPRANGIEELCRMRKADTFKAPRMPLRTTPVTLHNPLVIQPPTPRQSICHVSALFSVESRWHRHFRTIHRITGSGRTTHLDVNPASSKLLLPRPSTAQPTWQHTMDGDADSICFTAAPIGSPPHR
jgi:hypothetical protein